MAERIDTAAVLGAGVMGAGIAAHLAGAGIKTHLLDIVPPDLAADEKKDPKARNRFADAGLKKALESKPAAFYDPDAARLITPGNFEDHMERLGECDLVIEAVIEKMAIKKHLFAEVAKAARSDTILASNTSGLSIAEIGADLPEQAQKRLVVMHFFNPVRYMRLLEIVGSPKTDPGVVARAARIGEMLGKGIVYGKDTPNFVANRIGIYGMMQAIKTMMDDGYTIEEVDTIVGKPMGRAAGPFKTGDLVGIDTFIHVAQNCYDTLPDDEERDIFSMPDWIKKLVESGRAGRKTKAGFYKKEGKEIRVLDLESLDYRDQAKVRFDSLGIAKNVGIDDGIGERIKGVVNADDRAGQFAWKVMSRSLCYTARRIPEIADDIVNVDRAMRWGFNWALGPFETWDAIGVPESVERMTKEGLEVPTWVLEMVEGGRKTFYADGEARKTYFDVGSGKAANVSRDPHQIRIAVVKEDKKKIVNDTIGATLVDLGDGCLCVEVHTKMNTIDDDVIAMLKAGVEEAEKNFEALVIANDGEHFGAGANLLPVFMASQQKQWAQIEKVVGEFQQAVQGLRYAKVPVVSAPFQYTFGGCAEIVMSSDASVAHAETYMGLVEVGVGLVPAGGGCLRMAERWTDHVAGVQGATVLPFIAQGVLNIAMAKVATGASDAKRLRYLLPSDGISLNRDHLLHHAKQLALGMARSGYRRPGPRHIEAAGYDAAKTIALQAWGLVEGGWASEHDALIAKKVAHIVCGGNVPAGAKVDEQHFLDLEREAFVSLCGEEKSRARMQSILMTNKPLRN
ncbi:MAG: 3-hydroxyacyl-CoA dehydrogenase/enoyl-CoA hydratase family protein [Myxococcota bacterium]